MTDTCPQCGKRLEAGFIHAGGDMIRWFDTDPDQCLEGTGIPLQTPAKVRSFRLARSLEPRPLHAARCQTCRLVLFVPEPVAT